MKNTNLKLESKPFEMPDSQYRSIDALHSTELGYFAISPRKCQLYREGKEEPTPAMLWGTTIHSAILEPEKFMERYVTEPATLPDGRKAGSVPTGARKEDYINRNTNEWKAFVSEWAQKNTGKIQLDADEFTQLRNIMAAVHSHPIANALIKTHQKEMVALWVDEETGLKCKGKADLIGEFLIDFKTTTCETPKEFERECYSRSYHSQMAFYDKGFRLNGCDFKKHFIIGLEKRKKGECSCLVMEMSPELIERGYETNKRLMGQYLECKKNDKWPGFEGVYSLQIPAWAVVDLEQTMEGNKNG